MTAYATRRCGQARRAAGRAVVRGLRTAAALVLATVAARAADEPAGGVRAVVTDAEFGGPVPQVDVRVLELQARSKTGADGSTFFTNVPPGAYTVLFSKSGYERRVESSVVVASGRLADIALKMRGEFTDMEELVVRDMDLAAASEAGLLQVRQETPAVMDAVGAELIGKAGQSTVAGALKLVAGASVEDGKYAVIRGLGDRYTSAQINGVRLPSADPEKRAVQLDQFPTALIESLQVTKTFLPDQQGDAGAGSINLITRSLPEERGLSAKLSKGYRRGITQNEQFISNARRTTYWGEATDRALQMRSFDIPVLDRRRDFDGSVSAKEDALDQITRRLTTAVGTTRRAPPPDESWGLTVAEHFDPGWGWRFGGLLSTAYSRKYDGYFDAVKQVVRANTGDEEAIEVKQALHESRGVESVLWGRVLTLGLEAGENHSFSYAWLASHAMDNISTEQRRDIEVEETVYSPQNVGFKDILDYTERDLDTRQWRGRHRFGLFDGLPFAGSLTLRAPELDWTSAHSVSRLDQPDRTESEAMYNTAGTPFWGNPSCVRTWYFIEETSDQQAFNFKFPFVTAHEDPGSLKGGTFRDVVHRAFSSDYVAYDYPPVSTRIRVDGRNQTYAGYLDNAYPVPDLRYTPSISSTGRTPLWDTLHGNNLGRLGRPVDVFGTVVKPGNFAQQDPIDYEGRQNIEASYAMYDLPVAPWLRLVGGARWESTDMDTVVDSHSANDTLLVWRPEEDENGAKVIRQAQVPETEAGVAIHRTDMLPAFGLILEPREQLFFRLNWSRTIARPTFKEITPVLSPVYGSNDRFVGNRDLVISDMENRDVRAEWFYGKGALVGFSAFEKEIANVIDRDLWTKDADVFILPVNYPEAEVSGIELEWRQPLGALTAWLDGFTVGANYTRLNSSVPYDEQRIADLAPFSGNTERAMQAQPDRLMNLNLTFENRLGTSFNVFYSYSGHMLIAGESYSESSGGASYTPNLYQAGMRHLTFGISQKLFKHWTVGFSAKQPQKSEVRQYYEADGQYWSRSEVPTSREFAFSLSASY